MARAHIAIPAPVVGYHGRCEVLNYRLHPPRWEPGVVIDLKYEAMHGPKFRWTYSVQTDRWEKCGYTLFVGDDKIRAAGPAPGSQEAGWVRRENE